MKTYNYIPLYTYEDYKGWKGDWELINGYPHALYSSTHIHQKTRSDIQFRFRDVLRRNDFGKDNYEMYFGLDRIASNNKVVRPDLMIVAGEFKDDYLKFPPALIVEILSAETSIKDFNNKFRLYESQKVKYYIIVNPETKECNLFELRDDVYVQNENLKDFSFHADCKIVFDIPAYVAQLNLD